MNHTRPAELLAVILLLLTSCLSQHGRHVALAGDWPQILGPHRSGIADPDERLADTWPASGPQEVWRRPVG
ncbi:MAG: hypothetical protein ACR2NF_04280, partial [Pirellulales bacterium]